MVNKLSIGILYLGLHNQLTKKYGVGGLFSRKEIFCKLGKHYIIPKQLRCIVIKEMIEKKLIKKHDRDKFKVLNYDVDIEKDIDSIYKLAGIV